MTKDTLIELPDGSQYKLTLKALEFCKGLEALAEKHGCSVEDLFKTLVESQEETKKRT